MRIQDEFWCGEPAPSEQIPMQEKLQQSFCQRNYVSSIIIWEGFFVRSTNQPSEQTSDSLLASVQGLSKVTFNIPIDQNCQGWFINIYLKERTQNTIKADNFLPLSPLWAFFYPRSQFLS